MPNEEVWIKTSCPQCKTVNWICDGDIEDLTVSDIEGIECYKCSYKWARGDLEDFNYDPYYEKGRKNP